MSKETPGGAFAQASGSVTETTSREWIVSVLVGRISGKDRWGGNFSCDSFVEAKSLLKECAEDDARPWRIVETETVVKTEIVYESQNNEVSGRLAQTNKEETTNG